MRSRVLLFVSSIAFVGLLLTAATLTQAQQGPGGKKGEAKSAESAADFVARMMSYNKAKDGKLTKEEVTDKRLHFLFERADTNKDGVVTKEELEALYAKENLPGGGDGGFGGPGGPGGEGGKGKKGGKNKGGFGGPPQQGQIMPTFLQDALNLTEGQRKEVADLQKDVDTKLSKILTEEQRQQMREMREKGPGGFGGPPFGDKKGPGEKKGPPPEDK